MKIGPKILLPAIVLLGGLVATTAVVVIRPSADVVPHHERAPLVQVTPVSSVEKRLVVEARGTIEPRIATDLVSEASGRIVWVSPALSEGSFFEKDEVLARLESGDYETALERALAAVERSESQLTLAEATLERRDTLRGHGASSQAQLDEAASAARIAQANLREAQAAARQARLDLARTEIRAPFPGRVHARDVALGQFVQRGAIVARIHAIDFAEIKLPVSSSDLALLELPDASRSDLVGPPRPGPEVVLRGSYGGAERRWTGHLVRSEGAVDPKTRMVTVVARVADPYALDREGQTLPAGLFVNAEIQGRVVPDLFEIPRRALRGQDRIVVVDGDNRARERRVEVVRTEDESIWVRSGLQAGDRVCTTPPGVFVDGMNVRVAVQVGSGPA